MYIDNNSTYIDNNMAYINHRKKFVYVFKMVNGVEKSKLDEKSGNGNEIKETMKCVQNFGCKILITETIGEKLAQI